MPTAPLTVFARSHRRSALALACVGLGLMAPLFVAKSTSAQTVPAPYDCRSMDPTKWPASSKPYFMVALDTSGSMDSTVSGAAPSCAGYPSTRVGHARCALANMVKAYDGQVNMGLATFPTVLQPTGSATGACADGTKNNAETDVDCGGSTCRKCVTGKACTAGGDCVSNSCVGNVCQPITCPTHFLAGGTGGNITGIGCTINTLWTGTNTSTCGNDLSGGGGAVGAAQRGAAVLVPLPADDYWNSPPTSASNTAALLSYVDNQCGDCKEVFSGGYTPLNGVLRDMFRYLSTSWSAPNGVAWNVTPVGPPTYNTPLTGTERNCRSVNVILITDGGETCPTDNSAVQAQAAATALRTTGWTIGSDFWTAKTYVIDVGGATPATGSTNIATAGGTAPAHAAQNEVALSQALASIIGSAIQPETCDNKDNNCNGCIDEGSKLYCSRSKTPTALATLQAAPAPDLTKCCLWAAAAVPGADRAACVTAFNNSISASLPQGNQSFLPCWNAATDTVNEPLKWLCANPGEVCDNADNNCETQIDSTQTASFATNVVDEGMNKCGSPLACPAAETCDTKDNNCDGIVDNTSTASSPFSSTSAVPYSACPNNCQKKTETCNGCDDDCDGIADNGAADQACNLASPPEDPATTPPNCAGVQHCTTTGQAVAVGGCVAGVTPPFGTNEYGACIASPAATDTTCNNLDDNCNGLVDENAPPTACDNGFPALKYKNVPAGSNLNSQCVMGLKACHGTTCDGWIGQGTEICDGIDNDCNGVVDDGVPGVGVACGITQGICTKGTTACIGGAIVCTGGTQPQPEVCDGIDNNCNLQTDEAPLTDGPSTPGCWQNAGNACTFVGAKSTVTWSPPSGATCSGVGTLTSPCQAGALVCSGGAWSCQGGQLPSAEVCDGQDNNCNGTADDNISGIGAACAPPGTVLGSPCQGVTSCSAGVLTCSGGASPSPEFCDGKDNNCNGIVDDNPVDVGTVCGSSVGTCKTGILSCVGAKPVCTGSVGPSPEVCDGLDNNCDGTNDNALTDAPAAAGCWSLAGNTCTYKNATWGVPTGGTCSGLGTLTAPCYTGTLVCAGANKWVCQGGNLPTAEVCDGQDNNCDGTPDNGSLPGTGTACGTAPSILPCKKGTNTCVSGSIACIGEIGPTTEVCDGIDNNCDGSIDEGNPGGGASCGSSTGICKKGTTTCVSSAGPPASGSIQCVGGVNPGTEVCNGLDDNCDGSVDNNLTDAPPNPGCWTNTGTGCGWKNATWSAPPGATCTGVGTLTSPCAAGTLVCSGLTKSWACQGGIAPQAEACDGIDNNCNGTVDDGNPGGGASCGPTLGVCAPGGVQTCLNGTLQCSGAATPGPELCNGLDDNCNGIPDNLDGANIVGVGQICGSNTGACKSGVTQCVINVGPPLTAAIVCQGETTGTPEVCNGIDDDCNGIVDDAPTDAPADLGCWNLPGTTCTNSTGLKWDFPPGASCTGLGTGAGALTSPCAAGAIICKNGAWSCLGARVPTGAEICDGVDNNCNGTVDEGNPGGGASCGDPANPGTAPCQKGTLTCTNGALVCAGEVKPSTEICDGIDNNCNGVKDDGTLPGTGVACTDKCGAGTRICVGGSLVCQTTRTSQPEVCNGIDDDCNGLVDDGVLADAPVAGKDGCWNVNLTQNAADTTSGACHFTSGGTPAVITTWDTPTAGAACDGLGSLTTPCQSGRLSCNGAKGWTCIGGKVPTAETCDGQDQNCDGVIDDGDPGAGAPCQVGTGTASYCSGTVHCTNGALTCNVQAKAEVCNGLDDDCNGVIDNGLSGAPCNLTTYDHTLYPGDRTQGECRPGTSACDPQNPGQTICNGAVGPQPEVCDGLDNDCDGTVDEAGPAPDGVDGSVNPTKSSEKLGELCGSKVGQCKQGNLACSGGKVICSGAIGPQPEFCDCLDNNCDGQIDETPTKTTDPALCGPGTFCVKNGNNCECAAKCKSGEFPCSPGEECKSLPLSSTPTQTDRYCIDDTCGDCTVKTVKDECGPVGTLDSSGSALPLCQCSGGACHGPCATTVCASGLSCVPSGSFAGTCRPQTDCRFFGCPSGKACSAGACVDNPCAKNDCTAPTAVCKPNATFDAFRCTGSCADVSCSATQRCVDGTCEATGCASACKAGQLCLASGTDGGGSCGPSKCSSKNGEPACLDGSYCDPYTGSCGNDPCSGVVCPGSQVCVAGECVKPTASTGGTGGTTGAGGATGSGATDGGGLASGGRDGSAGGAPGSGASAGKGTTQVPSKEVIGLATGGGGCRCDLPARGTSSRGALGLGALLVGVLVTRRRARKEGGAR